ncbi:hypothetical protein BGZ99_005266 [Dissophora globulifera]|uniref:Uncharacterized protein n=1 Tax=Dissophora globulifera TaxID=979702 RepID=A0A9P6RHK5_9FUNG|nr:hypothetical protein BGZ99_005266 [Dissophora globulifera]
MKIPSAESARALTQAVILARLCGRYHDLASYASELLKQRIHFLANPDGSNLQELFIWGLPSSSASSASPVHPASSTLSPALTNAAATWTAVQMDEYLHQHWSPDQLPLNPPSHTTSWEATPIYVKALDTESMHAMVPIGRVDGVTLAVVLVSETTDTAPGSEVCWKYHNMTVFQESDLKSAGWSVMTDNALQTTITPSLALQSEDHVNDNNDRLGEEEDDSDDDYWGQYGDSDEDHDSAVDKNDKEPATAAAVVAAVADPDDTDDEESYWKKYAEQQEQQEEQERKHRLQQQRQGQEQEVEDQTLAANPPAQLNTEQPNPSAIGQVDPTMLSSLLQMLVTQGGAESSTVVPAQDALAAAPASPPGVPAGPNVDTDAYLVAPRTASLSRDETLRSKVLDSLRSAVMQASQAGYAKDEVFSMLDDIYRSSE